MSAAFAYSILLISASLQAGQASGGPVFSALPEKIGEKRGAWLRLGACCGYDSGGNLNCSLCEHTKSPYARYGTRRLLRYNRFVSSCDLISAVKTPCVRNLQGSTDSPKISVKIVHSAGPMWASAPAIGASKIYASSGAATLSAARSGVTVCISSASVSESVMESSRSNSQKQSPPANMASHIR